VYLACNVTRAPVRRVEGIVRRRGERIEEIDDTLAVEEPLEIRLAGLSVAVTMRTPGDDLDLAAGFLYTEGAIVGRDDLASIAYCPTDDEGSAANIVNVIPIDPSIVDPTRWQRNVYTTSSCGICGRASIDRVRQDAAPLHSSLQITPEALFGMARALGEAQHHFGSTGGLHAAALFDAHGTLVCLREDVGRHNAVDKVIGDALQRGALPLRDHVLLVSSRASFEIVQKSLVAGIPVVAAVSAASTLAVDLARDAGMGLIGFLRPDPAPGRFSIYAGAEQYLQDERIPLSVGEARAGD
jgi:FdhD protein